MIAPAGRLASSSIRRSQSATVVHSGFSTSACRSVARTSADDVDVGVVGVTTTTASHSPLSSSSLVVAGTAADVAGPRAAGRAASARVGVGDRRDDRAVDRGDVLDVLDTHHPRADHAVADGRPRAVTGLAKPRTAGCGNRARCREGHRLCRWLPSPVSMHSTCPRSACSSPWSSSAASRRRRRATASPSRRPRPSCRSWSAQLGVQLLDRGPSGSVATAAGVQLAPACAEVVAAAVALVDRGRGPARTSTAAWPIATTRHVADHFLPGWIAEGSLAGRAPRPDRGRHADRRADRAGGEAVLGFTDGPAAPLGLRSVVVGREQVVPVVGRSHPVVRPAPGPHGREPGRRDVGAGATGIGHPRRGRGRARRPSACGATGHRVEVAGVDGGAPRRHQRRGRRVPAPLSGRGGARRRGPARPPAP